MKKLALILCLAMLLNILPVSALAADGWTCENGHEGNTGNFCTECGAPKPEADDAWTCPNGHEGNTGRFCPECGAPKPEFPAVCPACGFDFEGSKPKFCPECGTPLQQEVSSPAQAEPEVPDASDEPAQASVQEAPAESASASALETLIAQRDYQAAAEEALRLAREALPNATRTDMAKKDAAWLQIYREPENAAASWLEPAEQGDDFAQAMLGYCYQDGYGVEKDSEQALIWNLRAAAQANDDAMFWMGTYSDIGLENNKREVLLKEDLLMAKAWYSLGAELGDTYAKKELDNLEIRIKNAPPEPETGMLSEEFDFAAAAEEALLHLDEPFQNALASDDPEALYAAGQEYSERYSQRMPDAPSGDILRAYQLYLKAAGLGHAKSQYNAARFLSGVFQYPIDQNDEESFRWVLEAAEQGYLPAYSVVINSYRKGTGVEQSEDSAKQWEEKLAADTAQLLKEAGSPDCTDPEKLIMAAESCQLGRGMEKDVDKALEYYQRAAEAGNILGARMLGNLYRQAYVIEKDISKSIEWYTKAWELGDMVSGNALASIYRYGGGEGEAYREPEKAAAILQDLAEKGDAIAQADLADMYMSGEGVPWDSAKAFKWYLESAAQDYAYAEYQIADIFAYGLSGSDYEPLIAQNPDLAKAFLTRAADQGYPYASDALANFS